MARLLVRRPGSGIGVPIAGHVGLACRAQAGAATISGRITATGTGQPVPDSRVCAVGSTLTASMNAEGCYTIGRVATGAASVVLRLCAIRAAAEYREGSVAHRTRAPPRDGPVHPAPPRA